MTKKLNLDLCSNIEDIEVKFKLINKPDLLAIFSLDFGSLSVKGYRLQKSKYEDDPITRALWITPPVYFDQTKKAHPIVYFEPKEKWDELRRHIMVKYGEAVDKNYFPEDNEDKSDEMLNA